MQSFLTFISNIFSDSTLVLCASGLVVIAILAAIFLRKFISMETRSYRDKMKLMQEQLNEQQRKKREDLDERRKRIEERKKQVKELE